MSADREIRVWRAFGGAFVFSAVLIMALLVQQFSEQGRFNWDMLHLLALAALAELAGIVMLNVSRGMERLRGQRQDGTALGWAMAAFGLAGIVWFGHEAATSYTPMVVMFQLVATLVLVGGLATIGTERLLRHVVAGRSEAGQH